MSQRAAETRLFYLKIIALDTTVFWRFAVTAPSLALHCALTELARTECFAMHAGASFKGRETYEITDSGMWLLSHCFANWEEAFAEAKELGKAFEASPPPFPGASDHCAECGVPNRVEVRER